MALRTMNELNLLRGKALILNDKVQVKHPTLSQIADDDRYEKYLPVMTSTLDDVADILWVENEVYYEDIESEWIFFTQKCLAGATTADVIFRQGQIKRTMKGCAIVNEMFRDAMNYFFSLDCEYFVLEVKRDNTTQRIIQSLTKEGGNLFYDSDNFKLTEHYYNETLQFLRDVNGLSQKYLHRTGGTKRSRKYILSEQYKIRQSRSKNKRKPKITLDSIVSGLIARGVSQTEIWDWPIYLVYDQFARLNKQDEYSNICNAVYAGTINTKKNPVDWEKINWASIY